MNEVDIANNAFVHKLPVKRSIYKNPPEQLIDI